MSKRFRIALENYEHAPLDGLLQYFGYFCQDPSRTTYCNQTLLKDIDIRTSNGRHFRDRLAQYSDSEDKEFDGFKEQEVLF